MNFEEKVNKIFDSIGSNNEQYFNEHYKDIHVNIRSNSYSTTMLYEVLIFKRDKMLSKLLKEKKLNLNKYCELSALLFTEDERSLKLIIQQKHRIKTEIWINLLFNTMISQWRNGIKLCASIELNLNKIDSIDMLLSFMMQSFNESCDKIWINNIINIWAKKQNIDVNYLSKYFFELCLVNYPIDNIKRLDAIIYIGHIVPNILNLNYCAAFVKYDDNINEWTGTLTNNNLKFKSKKKLNKKLKLNAPIVVCINEYMDISEKNKLIEKMMQPNNVINTMAFFDKNKHDEECVELLVNNCTYLIKQLCLYLDCAFLKYCKKHGRKLYDVQLLKLILQFVIKAKKN